MKRRTVFRLGAGAIAAIGAPLSASERNRSAWIPDAERSDRLERLFQERNVAGASAAIFEAGEVAWTWSGGVQNVETGRPVNEFTLFQAASLTKPVTAYIAMQMVEHGLIRLEDRLIDYHRPVGLSDHPWSSQVTVLQALTHTSGLPNWPDGKEDVVIQPAFEPGKGYDYSGQAFQWVQAALETISGASLQELAQQYLFAPAGLGDMAMHWLPGRAYREALGHVVNDAGENELDAIQFDQIVGSRLHELANRWGRELSSFTLEDYRAAFRAIDSFGDERVDRIERYRWERPDMALSNAAASLRTTPSDYTRFLALMLPGQGGRPGLLSDESRRMMLTPQAARGGDKANMPPGIGWGLELYEGRWVYHHWGQNGPSYVSNSVGEPDTGRAIVVMANSTTGGPFIDAAARLLTGTPYTNLT